MLWTILRDFFVQHIFGGTLSNGDNVVTYFGRYYATNGLNYALDSKSGVVGQSYVIGGNVFTGGGISIADWLSTTATIISLIFLVIVLALFVRWIFRLFSGLFRFH